MDASRACALVLTGPQTCRDSPDAEEGVPGCCSSGSVQRNAAGAVEKVISMSVSPSSLSLSLSLTPSALSLSLSLSLFCLSKIPPQVRSRVPGGSGFDQGPAKEAGRAGRGPTELPVRPTRRGAEGQERDGEQRPGILHLRGRWVRRRPRLRVFRVGRRRRPPQQGRQLPVEAISGLCRRL